MTFDEWERQPLPKKWRSCVDDWRAERERLTEQVRELEETLVQAAVILEALHASVRWELAENIRVEIADKLPVIRQALGVQHKEGKNES